jgi:alpha-1,3-mannosylglycoprotein beta-1,4-N-acetylglucosaminyltransferase A/B
LSEGLLLVIRAPDTEFLFETDHLKRTYNDSLQRVRWRSKQNLDYAALMEFSAQLSQYYLQVI